MSFDCVVSPKIAVLWGKVKFIFNRRCSRATDYLCWCLLSKGRLPLRAKALFRQSDQENYFSSIPRPIVRSYRKRWVLLEFGQPVLTRDTCLRFDWAKRATGESKRRQRRRGRRTHGRVCFLSRFKRESRIFPHGSVAETRGIPPSGIRIAMGGLSGARSWGRRRGISLTSFSFLTWPFKFLLFDCFVGLSRDVWHFLMAVMSA